MHSSSEVTAEILRGPFNFVYSPTGLHKHLLCTVLTAK